MIAFVAIADDAQIARGDGATVAQTFDFRHVRAGHFPPLARREEAIPR
ncbi:hypothetical protein [Sphingomonas sp. SRS2]|nr:hypothetical protein [Sphingomonas sp. SRS2]